jgi:hypothetical protein
LGTSKFCILKKKFIFCPNIYSCCNEKGQSTTIDRGKRGEVANTCLSSATRYQLTLSIAKAATSDELGKKLF